MRSLISAVHVPAALVLSIAALTACGGGESSDDAEDASSNAAETAWLADVEKAMGGKVGDVEAARQQAVQDCSRTTEQEWTVELALSGVSTASEVTRVNLDHLCADAVPAFDKARTAVEEAADTNALLCSMPAGDIPDAAAMQVNMVCGR